MIFDLAWLLVWIVAGVPLFSLLRIRKLFSNRKNDYAYFLEWKGFPKRKVLFGRLLSSTVIGLLGVTTAIFSDKMPIVFLVYLVCSILAESTILIGRSHPTPQYKSTRVACEKCRLRKDEECTNVRMLDGFERKFKSPDGRYRPICCCGFRISEWREAVAR